MRNTIIPYAFAVIFLIPPTLRAKQIVQAEHGLRANAEARIQGDSAILIVTNKLDRNIYIPILFEAKNTKISKGNQTREIHEDGDKMVFQSGFEVLKPTGTKQYFFQLGHSFDSTMSYTFTIWAPLRDPHNWKRLLDRSDVVYEIKGQYGTESE